MFGEVLVAARAITQAQLDAALQEQRRTGGFLGDVLASMGAISGPDLARALAREARMPFSTLDGAEPDARAVALVPEALARRAQCVPILPAPAGRLLVAQANPFDVVTMDELQRLFTMPVDAVCAPAEAVARMIDRAYVPGTGRRLDALVDEALAEPVRTFADASSDASPVGQLVDALIAQAVRAGATDLQLEPEDRVVNVRHRIDGVLSQAGTLPRELQPAVVDRLKRAAGLDIAEQRLPQDGRFSRTIGGRPVDGRVSSLPTVFGEMIAVRIVEPDKAVRGLADLGLNRRGLALVQGLLGRSRGIVLVTGPAGEGKTTTLYSALSALDGRGRTIMTVEDPVEYELPSIRQTQVHPRAGLTFATAIRSMLRQDPDVIMIGEIRDAETARLAVRAALSGALVFSAMHAQDAAGALPCLLDMGVGPHLLASSMAGVVAQRLVRLVCPQCKAPASYPDAALARVGLSPADNLAFVRGAGCDLCRQTGYRGRTGVFEILVIDAPLSGLIGGRADSRRLREAAVRGGFKSIRDDALSKAVLGQTTLDEVFRVSNE